MYRVVRAHVFLLLHILAVIAAVRAVVASLSVDPFLLGIMVVVLMMIMWVVVATARRLGIVHSRRWSPDVCSFAAVGTTRIRQRRHAGHRVRMRPLAMESGDVESLLLL